MHSWAQSKKAKYVLEPDINLRTGILMPAWDGVWYQRARMGSFTEMKPFYQVIQIFGTQVMCGSKVWHSSFRMQASVPHLQCSCGKENPGHKCQTLFVSNDFMHPDRGSSETANNRSPELKGNFQMSFSDNKFS